MRSSVAAASRARRPSSSHSTTGVPANGTASAITNSSCRRGITLAPGMWLLLYSPASLTSIRANGDVPSSAFASASGAIVPAMDALRLDAARRVTAGERDRLLLDDLDLGAIGRLEKAH